ncbi:hypothetical protein [Sphingobacterium sp. T2]|uniref:hypothetical protein n=1 Tax=Sphingobacterium sp. T2 TaxID=1590596 RepID=UPI00293451CD|nr:hypothetical protein [Sphingobacterium sp. T2]
MTLAEEVSFLNKVPIKKRLYNLPKTVNRVVINGEKSKFIDKDVIEVLKDFEQNALSKGLNIQLQEVTSKRKVVRTSRNRRLQESKFK